MNRTTPPIIRFALSALLIAVPLAAQTEDLRSSEAKVRAKAADKIGDRGAKNEGDPMVFCQALGEVVDDPARKVREEVVIALIKVGTQHCIEPLQKAAKDASPEIQSMAVDGLVDFYFPGYVKFGWINSVKSFGSSLKKRFAQPEPIAVQPYVEVPSDVIRSIAPLITGGSSTESRANAARAAGILRGDEATPELKEALKSKNSMIIREAVPALEKIGDPSAGPEMVFLLRDLDKRVQRAVAEAVGQLRTREAVEELVNLAKGSPDKDVRRAALTALAKIPDNGQEKLFLLSLEDKDDELRAAAAEGIGRAGNPTDLKTVQDAFAAEKNSSARLSLAFAAVHLGDRNMLTYIVDSLDSNFHKGEARAFLIELARDPKVLPELYTPLTSGTRDQKIELADVIALSGTRESLPYLDRLTQDTDSRVAEAAVVAIKNLQARL